MRGGIKYRKILLTFEQSENSYKEFVVIIVIVDLFVNRSHHTEKISLLSFWMEHFDLNHFITKGGGIGNRKRE